MGVRLYSPNLGRFLSVDPILGGNDNAYVYPTDPINMFDLDGRASVRDMSGPGRGVSAGRPIPMPWSDKTVRRRPQSSKTAFRSSMDAARREALGIARRGGGAPVRIKGGLGDSRYSTGGWQKMQHVNYAKGYRVAWHWMYNSRTGRMSQFKMVTRKLLPE